MKQPNNDALYRQFSERPRYTLWFLTFVLMQSLLAFVENISGLTKSNISAWLEFDWIISAVTSYWVAKNLWWQSLWKARHGITVAVCGVLAIIFGTALNAPYMDAPKVIDKQTAQRHRLADLQQFMADKRPLAIKRTLEDLRGFQFDNLAEQTKFEGVIAEAEQYLASPTAAKRIKELEKEQEIARQEAEKERQKAEAKAKREREEKAKLEVKLEKEAKRLLRINYPKETEKIFLKQGMDVYITVEGRNKDILRLKYVLFSRPLVYQITNQSRLMNTWKELGFKKVIFDTGHGQRWDIDLGG